MGGRPLPLYERVRCEQVRALAANLPLAVGGNLANLAVALVLIHGVLPPALAAGWAAALLLTLLARLSLYRRPCEPAHDPERRLRLHILGALATGTVWGGLFFLLPPLSALPRGDWLAFQVAGLSAGAALLDAPDRRVAAGFALPLLAGFALHLALIDGSFGARLLSGLVALYAGLLLASGRIYERRFVRLARLSAERRRLLEERLEERRRMQAERAGLEAECALLRGMAEALPSPFALFSPDGTGPRFANAAFRGLLEGREGARLFARASALARRAAAEGAAEDALAGGPPLRARRLAPGVLVWAPGEVFPRPDGSGTRHLAATGPPAPHPCAPRS